MRRATTAIVMALAIAHVQGADLSTREASRVQEVHIRVSIMPKRVAVG